MSRALRWPVELRRQLRRTRTRWSYVLVLALPLVLVGAFALGDGRGGAGPRFVDLATTGGANFTIFTLFAAADFLLVVLAALFAGDTLPSEASWSSLRYLLAAPVPRPRLLTAKLVVAVLCTVASVVLLVAWTLGVGTLFYGSGDFTAPGGLVLPAAEFWPRLGLAVGYLAVTLLQIVGIAFLLGTRTDSPLAAAGGTVLLTIVAQILQAVDALGDYRHALPMAYASRWSQIFTSDIPWTDLQRGALWSVLWFLVTVAGAYASFARKDVLS